MNQSLDTNRRPRPSGSRVWLSDRRLIAAGVFALVGVGAGVWTIFRPSHAVHVEIDRAARSQRIFEDLGIAEQPITPVPDDAFVRSKIEGGFTDIMPRLRERFEETAAGVEILRDMPSDARTGFAEAAVLAISPYLLVDFDMHLAHIDSLGGVPPRNDPEDLRSVRFRWEHAYSKMAFTGVAPAFAQIHVRASRDNPPGKFEHYELGRRFGMQEPGGYTSRTAHRYPGVSGWDNPDNTLDTFFAYVPVRMLLTKSGESTSAILGVSLAQNPDSGDWQPVELRLIYDKSHEPMFDSIEQVDAYRDYMPSTLWM